MTEELLITETNPKIDSAQERLVTILKNVLNSLKQDFMKRTGDVLPIVASDLVETSNGEFEAKIASLPVGYTSDYIEDIRRVRRILLAFGGFSYGHILKCIDNFESWIADYPYYKGFK